MKPNCTPSHSVGHLSFEQFCQVLMSDPSLSHWVKRAIAEVVRRDPVDAARDLDLLMTVLLLRLEELLAEPMERGESMRIAPVRDVPRTRM